MRNRHDSTSSDGSIVSEGNKQYLETKRKLSSFISCILNSFDALIIYTKSLKSKTSRVSLVIISLYTQDSFFPITKMYSKLFQFLSETNLAQTSRKLE